MTAGAIGANAGAGPRVIVVADPHGINAGRAVRSPTAQEAGGHAVIFRHAMNGRNAPRRSRCRNWTCSSARMNTASIHSRAKSR